MGNYFSKIQKGENKVQWYLIGIFLTFAGYFLGQLPLTAVAYLSIQNNNIGSKQFEEFSRTTDFNLIGIGSNLGLVLLITMFIFAIVG
ncbi:MAG TPA: hypothetical protein PLY70_18545, partial [Saprospiraceae bacterium]|nr:hypothetical protein [Saprospiraceae bacterium]